MAKKNEDILRDVAQKMNDFFYGGKREISPHMIYLRKPESNRRAKPENATVYEVRKEGEILQMLIEEDGFISFHSESS